MPWPSSGSQSSAQGRWERDRAGRGAGRARGRARRRRGGPRPKAGRQARGDARQARREGQDRRRRARRAARAHHARREPRRLRRRDLAIEAIVENEGVKMELFREARRAAAARRDPRLEHVARSRSPSSPRRTKRPEQVIGMHFMNPVPLMKLVEIIRGLQTVGRDLRRRRRAREAVRQDDGRRRRTRPGFIVNRILIPLLNEACFALQEGLGPPEDIDTAVKLGLNHPMGPLALADLIGPRHLPRHRRGAAPRARRRQVPAGAAAAAVRRGGLARPQDRARLLRLRHVSSRDGGSDWRRR